MLFSMKWSIWKIAYSAKLSHPSGTWSVRRSHRKIQCMFHYDRSPLWNSDNIRGRYFSDVHIGAFYFEKVVVTFYRHYHTCENQHFLFSYHFNTHAISGVTQFRKSDIPPQFVALLKLNVLAKVKTIFFTFSCLFSESIFFSLNLFF